MDMKQGSSNYIVLLSSSVFTYSCYRATREICNHSTSRSTARRENEKLIFSPIAKAKMRTGGESFSSEMETDRQRYFSRIEAKWIDSPS